MNHSMLHLLIGFLPKIVNCPSACLQSMVWNMPLEPMTTHQAVCLRLNPGSALVSSLENQYLWGQRA